jgi:hypothetical protein
MHDKKDCIQERKVDMWYLWKIHLHKIVQDSSLFLCARAKLSDLSPNYLIALLQT